MRGAGGLPTERPRPQRVRDGKLQRLEVFAGGRVLQLDNFRRLAGYGWPGFSKMNLWRQDKGQSACAAAFLQAVQAGGASPRVFSERCL
jgi:hypothetical protein